MKYLPRTKSRSGYAKKALWLVGIFAAGALLFSFLDNFLISAISPLWQAENRFTRTLAKSTDFFRSRAALSEENIALKEKIASLELELSSLSLASAEMERLLLLLGRRAETHGVTATILTHPPQSPYDLLVIDAGARDAIEAGARVILPEGPEMGVVEQVFPRFSRVKLLSTPGEVTPAVLEREEVPVELMGVGAGNFKIIVPRDTAVEVGDRVLTANLGAALVAVVHEVSLEPTDSFKEVMAKSPANIFSVRFVTVLP